MKIGTKSVLFGAHTFWWHPFFVALGWWRLYGFPLDPRLWFAFFVHDIGYIGKPNMDGPEGELHPYLGAKIMHALFDWGKEYKIIPYTANIDDWLDALENVVKEGYTYEGDVAGVAAELSRPNKYWFNFTLYHSRYLAKKHGHSPSPLCMADKLAIALTPAWLYLPSVTATGELHEYMCLAQQRTLANENVSTDEKKELTSGDAKAWYKGLQSYMFRWVDEHKDGKSDTWTASGVRSAVDSNGVTV